MSTGVAVAAAEQARVLVDMPYANMNGDIVKPIVFFLVTSCAIVASSFSDTAKFNARFHRIVRPLLIAMVGLATWGACQWWLLYDTEWYKGPCDGGITHPCFRYYIVIMFHGGMVLSFATWAHVSTNDGAETWLALILMWFASASALLFSMLANVYISLYSGSATMGLWYLGTSFLALWLFINSMWHERTEFGDWSLLTLSKKLDQPVRGPYQSGFRADSSTIKPAQVKLTSVATTESA